MVDFGSSMYVGTVNPKDSFQSSNFFTNMYGIDGPTTLDMTEKYVPLDLRIQVLLKQAAANKKKQKIKKQKTNSGRNDSSERGGATTTAKIKIQSDETTKAIDIWSVGIVLLEMILGTDKLFEMNGRKKLKIKKKIEKMMKNISGREKEIVTEELVDAVALVTSAMEYCIVPSVETVTAADTAYQKWSKKMNSAIQQHQGTSTKTKKKGKKNSKKDDDKEEIEEEEDDEDDEKQLSWFEQILPFLEMPEEDDECEDEIILRTLERRDPLNMGFSLMKEYDAIDLIQLLRVRFFPVWFFFYSKKKKNQPFFSLTFFNFFVFFLSLNLSISSSQSLLLNLFLLFRPRLSFSVSLSHNTHSVSIPFLLPRYARRV